MHHRTTTVYVDPISDDCELFIVSSEMEESFLRTDSDTPIVSFWSALTDDEMGEPVSQLTEDTGKTLITELMGTDFQNYRIKKTWATRDSIIVKTPGVFTGEDRAQVREALTEALGTEIEFSPLPMGERAYART